MPQRTKQKSPTENGRAKTDRENSQSAKREDDPQPPSANPRPPPAGLRKFVEEYKGKQHRIIEARVIIVCCFAVFGKLLFSDTLAEMEKDTTTYASLTFAACKLLELFTREREGIVFIFKVPFFLSPVCLLVIIFNTWLDYFPARLSNIQFRWLF